MIYRLAMNDDLKLKSVILIDSDPVLQRLVQGYVQELGVESFRAFDQVPAAIAAMNQAPCDLLMLDWKYKSSSAVESLIELSNHTTASQTRLILMAGMLTRQEITLAQQYVVAEFLVKPFTRDIFVDTFKRLKLRSPMASAQIESGHGIRVVPGDSTHLGRDLRNFAGEQQASGHDLRNFAGEQQASGHDLRNFEGEGKSRRSLHVDRNIPIQQPPAPERGDSHDTVPSPRNGKNSQSKAKSSTVALDQIEREDTAFAGVARALIVEHDPGSVKLLKELLKDAGVEEVLVAASGEEAWNRLRRDQVDLIYLDWKIRNFNSLVLYNRIRKHTQLAQTPTVIMCGYPERQDFRILESTIYAVILEKPFNPVSFDKLTRQLLNTAHDACDLNEHIADRLQAAFDQGEEIEDVIKRLVATSRVPLFAALSSGRYLMGVKKFEEAVLACRYALKVDTKNIEAITQLGHAYHRLNRCDEAYRLLDYAEGLSPENVERLCLLGEVGITLQNPARARIYFRKALAIDENETKARDGLKIADNLEEYVKDRRRGEAPAVENNFASVLNIIGITYIRNKLYAKGISQYRAAMSFVEDGQVLARLEYNMALAYLREKKVDDAKEWLARSLKSDPFYEKAADFLNQINSSKAGDSGAPLALIRDVDDDDELENITLSA